MADSTTTGTQEPPQANPFAGQRSDAGQQPAAGQADTSAGAGDGGQADEPKSGGQPAKSGLEADLARERRQRQELQRKLQQLEDAQKSDLQKAVDRAERAEAAAKDAARYRAAAKAGLTDPDLIERLRGDDDDALLADAKALVAKLGRPGGQPDPDQGKGGGTGNGSRDGFDMNNWMREASGRGT